MTQGSSRFVACLERLIAAAINALMLATQLLIPSFGGSDTSASSILFGIVSGMSEGSFVVSKGLSLPVLMDGRISRLFSFRYTLEVTPSWI